MSVRLRDQHRHGNFIAECTPDPGRVLGYTRPRGTPSSPATIRGFPPRSRARQASRSRGVGLFPGGADLTAATMRAHRDSLRSRIVTRSDLQAAPRTDHGMTSASRRFARL